MKATVAAIFSMALFAGSAVADKPKTVDEAVQVLKTKWLQPKDRDWILRNTKDEVRCTWGSALAFGTSLDYGETISLFTTRVARKTRKAVLL